MPEDIRKENIKEAKSIFEDFAAAVESGIAPWSPQKQELN